MKSLIITFSLLFTSLWGYTQTATNFAVADCDGVVYDLYAELDAGRVIVICWVMPCAPCVGPAKTSYNIVNSYQASHPGRVFYYLVDDYADTQCPTLNNWANSNGIPASSFSRRFSDNAINMNDYGSPGMPKIVVVGGSNYSVYYNQNSTVDATALQSAIDNALASTPVESVKSKKKENEVTVYPSPARDYVVISTNTSFHKIKSIDVFSYCGRLITSIDAEIPGLDDNVFELNTSAFSRGTYFVRVETAEEVYYSKFVKL